MMHAGPDELLRALAHLLDDWPTDDGLRELSRSVDQRLPSMLANPPGTVRRELALSVLADIDRHFRAVVVRPAAAREPLQRLVAVLGRDAVSRNRGRQVSRDLLDSWAATSSSPRWHGELERTRERLQALAVHPAVSRVIGELDAFYNRRHREVEQHTARLVRTLRLREESWATTRSESVADRGAGTDGGDSEVPEDAEPETVWSHAIRPPPP
jgi:hypothetical protein